MSRFLRWLSRYAISVCFVAAAVLATGAIRFNGAPSYVLLLVAVFAAAWYSGVIPALAAALFAIGLSHKVFPQPDGAEPIRVVLFLAASIAVTVWAYREKRLTSKLAESNRRFRLLMDNVVDYAIIVTDAAGNILDFNSGAERILGFDLADRGRSLEMIFPSEERNAFKEEIETARTSSEAIDERWHVRKDQSRFWGFGIVTALRDPSGVHEGYVKILRDLTRMKKAEEERERLFYELEKANGILEQMMAALAHDIRAPLTTILGWIALRRSGAVDEPAQVDHAFDVIERSAHKQLQLMEGLLELSKVKAGAQEPDFKTCNLTEIIYGALETIRPGAAKKQLQLEVFEDEPRMITGNAVWLMQVFTNILQNAVKFTPAGGTIRVTCSEHPDWFRTEIADSGIGIPSGLINEIFVPFKRGDTRVPGAGLGLAIVRELVQRHGGNVYARSEGPGKGSTFVVDLPIRATATGKIA